MRSERGFTIVEMVVVFGIIAILSALGITSLKIYKGNAAYAVAEGTFGNARTSLEAGIMSTEEGIPSVPMTTQMSQGEIIDPLASTLLPALLLPKGVKLQVSYDESCDTAACQESFLQIDSCISRDYVRWIRYGDGISVQLDKMSGGGC